MKPSRQSVAEGGWSVGIATAVADNIANNLPVGLVAGSVAASDHVPAAGHERHPDRRRSRAQSLESPVRSRTILWLVALRRERIEVGAWPFLEAAACW